MWGDLILFSSGSVLCRMAQLSQQAQLLSRSGKKPPVKRKTGTVPPDHSIGCDHNQGVFHEDQKRRSATQNNLSRAASLGGCVYA